MFIVSLDMHGQVIIVILAGLLVNRLVELIWLHMTIIT
uniref:Uncharacterized protein n=1 Tax=Aegilops tauschii subsp. strangulata TaxID=200361 RepID=A0A452Y058_AEGTS